MQVMRICLAQGEAVTEREIFGRQFIILATDRCNLRVKCAQCKRGIRVPQGSRKVSNKPLLELTLVVKHFPEHPIYKHIYIYICICTHIFDDDFLLCDSMNQLIEKQIENKCGHPENNNENN